MERQNRGCHLAVGVFIAMQDVAKAAFMWPVHSPLEVLVSACRRVDAIQDSRGVRAAVEHKDCALLSRHVA